MINITELMTRDDIRNNYVNSKKKVAIDTITEMPIVLEKWETITKPSMKGRDEEFMRLYFHMADDVDKNQHYIETQAIDLWDWMRAIPQDILEEQDVVAIISVRKLNGGMKKYYFAGAQ